MAYPSGRQQSAPVLTRSPDLRVTAMKGSCGPFTKTSRIMPRFI